MPSVISAAAVWIQVKHGLKLRMLMPRSQTAPGYISWLSNAIRI